MLVLTRRTGETIVIGDNIKLTVVGVKGSKTRLGVAVPKGVQVIREVMFVRLAVGPRQNT